MNDIYSELSLKMHHRKAFLIYVENVQTRFDVFSSALFGKMCYRMLKMLKSYFNTRKRLRALLSLTRLITQSSHWSNVGQAKSCFRMCQVFFLEFFRFHPIYLLNRLI